MTPIAGAALAKRTAGTPVTEAERHQRSAAAKARWIKQARTVYRGAPFADPAPQIRDFGAVYTSPYESNARYYAWVNTNFDKGPHYNATPTMNRYRLADDARIARMHSPEWNAIMDAHVDQMFGHGRWRDAIFYQRDGHDTAVVNMSPEGIEVARKLGVHAMESEDPGVKRRKQHAELVMLDPSKLIFDKASPAKPRYRRVRKVKVVEKRAPLSAAELHQRQEAGKASAEARHRAETSPSVHQGATTPPSRQAIALFRQGQSRPDTRSTRSVWDTRATEAPVGAMNASFTFHFPNAYRGKPDRPNLSPKTMANALGRTIGAAGIHQDVTITNPKTLVQAHRHPQMRAIIEHTINVVREHQKATIERGIAQRLIPEGTHPAVIVQAYKHAALKAIHKAGLGDYDTRDMSQEAKDTLRPLHRFMYYAHRRVFDHLNQDHLKGKWAPFRDEFGQVFRSKKHGKYTGAQRMRMRPSEDFYKIDLPDGDLEKAWGAVEKAPAKSGSVEKTTNQQIPPWKSPGGKSQKSSTRKPAKSADNPMVLARLAIKAATTGQPVPEPPGGIPPILGMRMRHKAQNAEIHLGSPFMHVPRIGGSTVPESGLYRVIPVSDLEKLEVPLAKEDFSFTLGNFNADPKRQLSRAMRSRRIRRMPRLRLNSQRHLRRLLSGGITRQDRWQLGATSPGFGKMAKFDAERALPRLWARRDPAGKEHALRADIMRRAFGYEEKGGRGQLLTEAMVRAAARRAKVPTKAQADAGNYRMGHVAIGGLRMTIETPKGRIRRGQAANGHKWAVKMPAHYGYIKGTEGADGDHVDAYLGPHAHEADRHPVHVVDQHDARSGRFDEHKAMVGFPTREHAITAYDAAFSDGRGPDRRKAVHTMTFADFRHWVGNGDTTTPLKKFAPLDRKNGHGHVNPRPDGIKARCGGPGLCADCKAEWKETYGMDFPDRPLKKSLGAVLVGAAAAGGAAKWASRGLARRRIRIGAHQVYTSALKDAVRDHLRTFEGGVAPPHVRIAAMHAFKGAKRRAAQDAVRNRNSLLSRASGSKLAIAGAAAAGGAAGLFHGRNRHKLPADFYTATPVDQY